MDGTGPGPYYTLPAEGSESSLVGSGGWKSENGNERAVHGAVLAIQRALNRRGQYGITATGKYDEATFDACVKFQKEMGLTYWGGVDQPTSKALLMPDLKSRCRTLRFKEWRVACGLVTVESAWDPGAVGSARPGDIGLAQIGADEHPAMSEKERLRPGSAFTFVIDYLSTALRTMKGNIDHAIVSYTLGLSDCKSWIAEGAPELYTTSDGVSRNLHEYVEQVKDVCFGEQFVR